MCKNNINKNREWRRERKKRKKNYFTLFPTYTGTKAQFPAFYRALFDETKSTYVEPCVGAGGMYFNISNGRYEKVYLNDLNMNLMLIYKCLRDEELRGEFIKRLEEVQIPEDEKDAKEYFENLRKKMHWWSNVPICNIHKEDILETAVKTYLLYAISKNCNADEYSVKQAKQFHEDICRRLPNVIESLHENVRFYSKNAVKIIDEYKNDSSVQFFIDTPYVGIYRSNKKLYRKELITLSDHVKLAISVKSCKGAVVMCGYRSQIAGVPTIYDVILGSKFKCYKICEKPNGAVRVKKGQKKPRCTEYVWTNHTPEYAGMYMSLENYRESMSVSKYWNIIMEKIRKGVIPKEHIKDYKTAFATCIELGLLPQDSVWEE